METEFTRLLPSTEKKTECRGGHTQNYQIHFSAQNALLGDTMTIACCDLTEFSNHFNANTRFIMGVTIQNRAQIHNKRLRAMESSKRNKYCARLIRLRLAFALSVAYTVVQCELEASGR
jgi:hypothetical protein